MISDTDGFHWLHFWLSQEPNSMRLLELKSEERTEKIKGLFSRYGTDYKREDKESAYLMYSMPIDEDFIKTVANIIEPLFANREKFF